MRRTPLVRRTPLKGATLQRGGATLARGQRIRPRSPRREAAMVQRRALVAAMLAERPTCELRWVCRGARSVDVHERLKRSRGGDILDPEQSHAVTTCRACHEMTELEPAEAERRRALLPSWHRCPEVGPC